MSNFYWRVLCCPSHSNHFKRRLPPIAESSQLSKRRKTFHGEDAEAHQRPTTSYTTQPDDHKGRENPFCTEDPCDSYSFHEVFLSHSGYQKSFVEQLFVDLQREHISCFFDRDPQSLPKGEDFPPRIFKAAQKCRVGVVVLSDEFIYSKWPMLELCQFVRAKTKSTNGRLKILPIFFGLSPESLYQKLQDKDSLKRSWQELLKAQQRTIDLDEWMNALQTLRSINGVVYNEQESEVDYRAKIVSSIRNLLPPVLRYDVSNVEGKERLCQKVARMFNNTPCGEDGVKIAGLYGVAGIGKTTLAKLACNFYSEGFDGRVLHVELGKGMAIERLKSALRVLTSASEMLVNSITDIEQGRCLFNNRMYGAKVFLALDNISDVNESMDEAKKYLRAVCSARNQSMVLLTARSSSILRRFILEEERSCMHVPSLTDEESIPLLLEHTPFRVCNLSSEKQDIAKKCALKCYFSWHSAQDYHNHLSISAYHPLALKAFGVSLYDSCPDLSRWSDIQNSSEPWRSGHEVIFNIFEESFQRLSEDYQNIFMFLCLYLPKSHMDLEEVYKWLALVCNTNVEHIKFAVNELHRKALVEMVMESCNRLYIHDLHMEFAEKKADGTGKWISLKKKLDIPASLQESDRPKFSAMRFDNCHFESPGFFNKELFRNVLVLHLQNMPQLKILDVSPMRILRSITIVGCDGMQEIRGLKSLTSLVYFVVRDCSPNVQISGIERLVALQHLQMDGRLSEITTGLSPLSWTLFPPLRSASFVSFVGRIQLDRIGKGIRRLDLSACSKLRTIELLRCRMVQIDLTGCLELREIVIKYCGNLREISPFSHNPASLETRAICSTLKSKSLFRDRPAFPNLTKLCLVGLHNLGKPSNHVRWTKMHSLTELPAFTGLTALEWLQLEGMHSLKELPALTGLTALKYLELEGMHSLKELPALTGLTALKDLELLEMYNLNEVPALTGLTALERLQLERMHSLKELPALTGLRALWRLKLEGMHNLKELPVLTGLTALKYLILEGMHSLKELPTLTGLTALEWLQLEGMHSLTEVPALTGLTALEYLILEGMHSLKELPALTGLTALRHLKLEGMHSLKELPALTGLTVLTHVILERIHSLKELPSLTGLTALQYLKLEGMHNLKELPVFTGLTALKWLQLEGMHSLKEVPALIGLTALEYLILERMHSLKELPALTGLTAFKWLQLEGMHSLKEVPALTGLTALKYLILEGMHSLKELPDLTGLTALEYLKLDGIHSLEELSPLTELTALKILDLEGMHNLKKIPNLPGLIIRLEGNASVKAALQRFNIDFVLNMLRNGQL